MQGPLRPKAPSPPVPTMDGGVQLTDQAKTTAPMAEGLRGRINVPKPQTPGNPMMNAAARFAMKRGVTA